MNKIKKYKHLFFDLDRTLWDFDKNSSETLREIIIEFRLHKKVPDPKEFIRRYNIHNDFVWDLYRNRKITKNDLRVARFRLLLADYEFHNEEFIKTIDEYYVSHSPEQGNLIDGAIEVLEYLYHKYKLHIVSNGFHETQLRKLEAANIAQFFERIYTSDRIGAAKPNKRFFEYALKSTNARKNESIVIGDDFENDVLGASNFGIDQIWYNPKKDTAEIRPTYQISKLTEIKNIL